MSTPFGQVVATDHRVVYQLRDQYIAATGNPEQQLSIALELMWNIARHTTTEQVLVHPLCVRFLGGTDGGKLAEFDDDEHQHVKDQLLVLLDMYSQGIGPGTSDFDNLLETALGELHRHNDSEESSDVPTLEKHMSVEEATRVAQLFEAAKGFFIPENFHPGSGNAPTVEALRAAITVSLEQIGPQMRSFLETQA
ncbi:hypothetical protein M422DRAFT_773648 [Sphaerobolus stellatus SS14]|nr:hypothetical protein M422DRAFT_773648 [Sphaerobolus stellatus SS14]